MVYGIWDWIGRRLGLFVRYSLSLSLHDTVQPNFQDRALFHKFVLISWHIYRISRVHVQEFERLSKTDERKMAGFRSFDSGGISSIEER